ncbi:phage portal protein [Halopseudomonas pachastrellae]|nr:phage portal protein [Halopseudomonas pachastrellae]
MGLQGWSHDRYHHSCPKRQAGAGADEWLAGCRPGFGGQLERWTPQLKTLDAALLPQLDLGNARAEDVTRNNAFAANGVQLHIDNIVGHLFRLSYKPRWRRLGITDEDAQHSLRTLKPGGPSTPKTRSGATWTWSASAPQP